MEEMMCRGSSAAAAAMENRMKTEYQLCSSTTNPLLTKKIILTAIIIPVLLMTHLTRATAIF